MTARELQVLRLVAAGKSNAEIADSLVMSVRTAERHLANIYAKLGTGGPVARAAATAYAHTNGLVSPRLP
jgi:DNA-binding NarL/FixJ family response regulator